MNKERSKCLEVTGENSSLYLLSPGSRIHPAVRSCLEFSRPWSEAGSARHSLCALEQVLYLSEPVLSSEK